MLENKSVSDRIRATIWGLWGWNLPFSLRELLINIILLMLFLTPKWIHIHHHTKYSLYATGYDELYVCTWPSWLNAVLICGDFRYMLSIFRLYLVLINDECRINLSSLAVCCFQVCLRDSRSSQWVAGSHRLCIANYSSHNQDSGLKSWAAEHSNGYSVFSGVSARKTVF